MPAVPCERIVGGTESREIVEAVERRDELISDEREELQGHINR